jgi:taurine dioxygenase
MSGLGATAEARPLAPALGAEIVGLELDASRADGGLDDAALAFVHKTLLDHQVVVVRDVALSPEQHLRLANRFGDTEVHAFFPNLGEGYERISVLDSAEGNVASMWHSDETFLEEPPMGTLLHAQVIPPVGGDTCWASCTAAYDALSPSMQRYLEGVSAMHDLSRTAELKYASGRGTAEEYARAIAAERRFAHPVVRTHPETGAKSLFVNPTYTRYLVGLPPDESETILGFLYRHMVKERFVVRHRWAAGDLVLWDNRCTMHTVLNDFGGHRRMYRVSVLGDRPR